MYGLRTSSYEIIKLIWFTSCAVTIPFPSLARITHNICTGLQTFNIFWVTLREKNLLCHVSRREFCRPQIAWIRVRPGNQTSFHEKYAKTILAYFTEFELLLMLSELMRKQIKGLLSTYYYYGRASLPHMNSCTMRKRNVMLTAYLGRDVLYKFHMWLYRIPWGRIELTCSRRPRDLHVTSSADNCPSPSMYVVAQDELEVL